MNKRAISLFEIAIILVSIIAFSYLVAQQDIKPVSAASTATASPSSSAPQTGCCKEANSGAICQDMNIFDSSLCKTGLIGTSCSFVSECQKGCCYSQDSGVCTLNSPKQKCLDSGAQWADDATCNIDSCQMGCCILGDGASMTTSRECTLLSQQYSLTKNFLSLDSKGSCDAYAGLTDEGACLTPSADFSNQQNCIFTTKGKCNGDFKKGYLCTSSELNTTCEKTTQTSCFEGKDQVYYLDSCGNRANVFDSSKYNDPNYWEKVIPPSQSCSNTGSSSCGNCGYTQGSVCDNYAPGKNEVKLDSGDYTCKNLNCVGGKKNGESWCVSDYNSNGIAAAAVGSRQYVATCSEGVISIEGCADFNQEVCIQSSDTTVNYTQATCTANDWRSCIAANNADNYNTVKQACDQLPQCIMFNDIPGNDIYKNLPGFKEIANDDQGKAGQVGAGQNKIIPYCVPRYTPGYQFWNTASSSDSSGSSTQSYGGSQAETNAICSLGSFTCVSHIEITSPLVNPTPQDMENPECNSNAVDQSNQKVSLMMQALNDRCRSLGSCGIQTDTQGQLGTSNGFTVSRTYIDAKGKSHANFDATKYVFPGSYINSTLKTAQAGTPMGQLQNLSQLTNISNQEVPIDFVQYSSSATIPTSSSGQVTLPSSSSSSGIMSILGGGSGAVGAVGALAGLAYEFGGTTAAAYSATVTYATTTGSTVTFTGTGATAAAASQSAEVAGSAGVNSGLAVGEPIEAPTATATAGGGITTLGAVAAPIALAAAAFTVGQIVGGMIGKAAGMSPGATQALSGAIGGGFAAITIGASWAASGVSFTAGFGATAAGAASAGGTALGGFAATVCAIPILCLAIIVAAIIYMIYSLFSGVDNEYYIQQFTCAAWQPPQKGDCNACNSDVRPCSEDKCKSLGQNCQYFLNNGEPGYCAAVSDIWSAKISPWSDVITSGLKYNNVTSFGFGVQANGSIETPAWQQVSFGIITDKEAICKLDTDPTKDFNSMNYLMLSDTNYATGKVDGMHHRIVLSPSALDLSSQGDYMGTTPPLNQGENIYYIKCQNFAGQTNDAPFAVKVIQANGPDLTPAEITRFVPTEGSYLAQGTTAAQLMFYLNEPATCKYDITYDDPNYDDMPYNFSCLTDPNAAFYGEWPCYGVIPNVTDQTQIFIKCKDQPNLTETALLQRNVNRQSIPYTFNICSQGLAITSTSPANGEVIDTTSNEGINLSVQTSGCISGGNAYCQYLLPEFGNYTSSFLQTGGLTHTQPLTTLTSGNHEVDVFCQDDAGNLANTTINFTLNVDTTAPQISRMYVQGDSLVLGTNKNAACLFSTNESIGCDFNADTTGLSFTLTHSAPIQKDISYFVKCIDASGNGPSGCTETIKPTS